MKDLEVSAEDIQFASEVFDALIAAESNLKDLALRRLEVDRWATDFSRRVDLALSGPSSETFLGDALYHFLRQTGYCISLRGLEKQIESDANSLAEKLRGNESDRNMTFDMIRSWLDHQMDEDNVHEKTSALLRILYRKLTGEEVPSKFSTDAERRFTFKIIILTLQNPELNPAEKADLESVLHFLNLQNNAHTQDLTIDEMRANIEANFAAANLSPQAASILFYNSLMAQLHIAYEILLEIANRLGVPIERYEEE